MTTTAAAVASPEQVEAVLQVFRAAPHPLTLTQAQKQYKEQGRGPALGKNDLPRIVREHLLLQGQVFQCSPSGKQPRYWVHDEEQRVRKQVEEALARGPVSGSKVATAVNKALPKVSSPAAIKKYLQAMLREGKVHEHPGKGKTKLLALQPFDLLAAIKFKKGTLSDLSAVFDSAQRAGVSLDQFLGVLRRHLFPPGSTRDQDAGGSASGAKLATPPPASPEQGASGSPLREAPGLSEVQQLILKGMRDLEPSIEGGAPVSLRELRRHMPAEYRRREVFDPAVLRLVEEGQIVIHRHVQTSYLSEQERDELVRDEEGHYYTAIAQRT